MVGEICGPFHGRRDLRPWSKGRWGWISPSQHRTTGCTRALPSSARSANGTSETDKGHERILETINTVGHDGPPCAARRHIRHKPLSASSPT
uniref:Uncharacterized protein n=1 Tax=Zea mays TaxID=4577 RepID=A0A804NFZ6_MAIZE